MGKYPPLVWNRTHRTRAMYSTRKATGSTAYTSLGHSQPSLRSSGRAKVRIEDGLIRIPIFSAPVCCVEMCIRLNFSIHESTFQVFAVEHYHIIPNHDELKP